MTDPHTAHSLAPPHALLRQLQEQLSAADPDWEAIRAALAQLPSGLRREFTHDTSAEIAAGLPNAAPHPTYWGEQAQQAQHEVLQRAAALAAALDAAREEERTPEWRRLRQREAAELAERLTMEEAAQVERRETLPD